MVNYVKEMLAHLTSCYWKWSINQKQDVMIKRENEITFVRFLKCSNIVLCCASWWTSHSLKKSSKATQTVTHCPKPSAAFKGILCLKTWKFPCGLVRMLDINKVTCLTATGSSERLWSQNRGRFPVNMNYSVVKPSRLQLRMGVRCASGAICKKLKVPYCQRNRSSKTSITCSAVGPLQWMGAVRIRVLTADKNITIIHKYRCISIN